MDASNFPKSIVDATGRTWNLADDLSGATAVNYARYNGPDGWAYFDGQSIRAPKVAHCGNGAAVMVPGRVLAAV